MRQRIRLALVCIALLAAPAIAAAQQTASVAPILTVARAGAPALALDRATLEKMSQRTIVTSTPWTDGATTFEGPLLRDVLAAANAAGGKIAAVAINDYKVEIPATDAASYDVIVALKRNGAYMPVRDKGPLWIIYPLDERADLRTPATHAKMIWQLKRIDVE